MLRSVFTHLPVFPSSPVLPLASRGEAAVLLVCVSRGGCGPSRRSGTAARVEGVKGARAAAHVVEGLDGVVCPAIAYDAVLEVGEYRLDHVDDLRAFRHVDGDYERAQLLVGVEQQRAAPTPLHVREHAGITDLFAI